MAAGTTYWQQPLPAGAGLAPSGTACYVAGTVSSLGATFGNGVRVPGPTAGELAGYVVRLNAQGVAQWARQLPVFSSSPVGYSFPLAVAVDEPRGRLYTAGQFVQNTLVQQTTALGAAGWTRQATGPGELLGYAIAVAPGTGRVYVAGSIRGSGQLGPHLLMAATATDGFVACLTGQGEVQWAFTFGSAGEARATHLLTNSADNAYVAGYFTGSGTFGPGATGPR